MNNLNFRAFQKSTKTMLPVNSLKAICTTSPRLTEEEFDDLIIMRSTGLFDKNGKVIFEGDILRIEGKNVFVYYNNDGLYELGGAKTLLKGLAFNKRVGIPLEIIGNIYENPELLNK